MDNNEISLSALSMDLKRVAMGLYRKSYQTADRFLEEAKKRTAELDRSTLLPYMQKIISEIEELEKIDPEHRAEDALMYSTRVQNYVIRIIRKQ